MCPLHCVTHYNVTYLPGGTPSVLHSGIKAGGNILLVGGGNLGGGGRAIVGGFVLSTATSNILPADGTRLEERLDASSVVVPEEIKDSIED